MKTFTNLTVISGLYKGKRLLSPGDSMTHPMGAREKNALFNRLDVHGARILDLFAGSGALGIEALSRGAKSVTFVDNSHIAAKVIRQNLQSLQNSPHHQPYQAGQEMKDQPNLNNPAAKVDAGVITSSVEKYLDTAHDEFDFILADPPYDKFQPDAFRGLARLLAPGGSFVLSSPASSDAPELPDLTLEESRTYAGARLSFYEKKSN